MLAKDMGSCEIFPQTVQHNCNGRFIVVCGDGEYIIYTSQALRNKAFGQALDFVWSAIGTGDYAIRESLSRVRTFKNFKEHKTIKAPIAASEGLFGGACLAVRGAECVCFFEWTEGTFLCKIDVAPTAVHWNETHELLLLVCEEQAFVLKYDRELVEQAINSGDVSAENGVVGAFEPIHEITDKITAGQWVGDCFLFSNSVGRLNYFVGGNTMTLCHLEQGGGALYMLGYLPKEDRVFLMDRSRGVVSYKALLAVLQYQTAVVRKDFDAANQLLPAIPEAEHSSVARFLEQQGYKDVALQVSKDPDHKFDLALELELLEVAEQLLVETRDVDRETTEYQTKWKRLGDVALAKGDLRLAELCAESASDLAGLLLLYTSSGDRDGTLKLAEKAVQAGAVNVAFLAFLVLGRVEDCFELLLKAGRVPEAALLARTYLPSQISRAVKLWREDLKKVSERAAAALADPQEFPNLFPDLEWALQVEQIFKANRENVVPSVEYPTAKEDLELDLIALVKDQAQNAPQVAEQDDAHDDADDLLKDDDGDDDATADAAAASEPAPADEDDPLADDDDDADDLLKDDDDDDELAAAAAAASEPVPVDEVDPLADEVDPLADVDDDDVDSLATDDCDQEPVVERLPEPEAPAPAPASAAVQEPAAVAVASLEPAQASAADEADAILNEQFDDDDDDDDW